MDHRGSRNTLSTARNVALSTPGPIRNRSPVVRVTSTGVATTAAPRFISTIANFTGSCRLERFRQW
jgi:hypothetical protein